MSKSRGTKTTRTAWDAALASEAADPVRRAQWLASLDHQLRPSLPLQLTAHARLANVDGTRLVYVVDGPIWRSRLRLSGDILLEAARSIGLTVDELVIRSARIPFQPVPRETRGTSMPSAYSAERVALRKARELIAQGPAVDPDDAASGGDRTSRLRRRRGAGPDAAS